MKTFNTVTPSIALKKHKKINLHGDRTNILRNFKFNSYNNYIAK